MRLLHTSDWHLGRSLHRASLAAAQEAFVDHLVSVVRAEQVDVVLVSGDVYDRAVPPLEAVQLCGSAFVRLRDAGAQVVVISGNHDSARRLGFGAELIDSSGVFLRTSIASCTDPVVIDGVPFFAIPYLDTGVASLSSALGRVRAVAPPISVVLAHAWVAGGTPSDSERDISVGGLSATPVSLFDGFTYSALGHLHGAQVLSESLRYSGSPLAYSFSEAAHVKGSWLLSVGPTGLSDVSFVPAPVPRRLSCARGPLDVLLSDPALASQEGDWLSITVTDTARPEAAMDRLSTRFPHVLVLSHEPEGLIRTSETYATRVSGRTDLEIAAAFVSHVRGTPAADAELSVLGHAFEGVRVSSA